MPAAAERFDGKRAAPERIRGVGADPRSDIYAIGIIAFERLIGGPPFAGKSDEEIMARLSHLLDPPGARRPSLKFLAELDAVVMKCIEKWRPKIGIRVRRNCMGR